MNDTEFIELVEKIYAFHTKRAPGIPIAAQMVLIAMEKLGKVKLGAVAETQVCLSDAIQFLTGCTIGNKYLILLDKIGRYALTLYDRKNGQGYRVAVDLKKIDPATMPETHKFFLRQRDPITRDNEEARKASAKIIVEEFMAARRDIFSCQPVLMKNFAKPPVPAAAICESCKESFLQQATDQKKCLVCDDSEKYAYYDPVEN
ncbi:MAG: FmdE family protein [Candidatus Riflebacteria bacterium]